ncbi:MAG: hypothetical protein ACLSWL_04325 [Ruminococcus sp.]|jgi:hypothetical protein|uniref:hypothetical protein n=1 Tax=Ruminococcus bromii TaxID=40518 RepID=UPI0026E99844|nr:hypothetical protein [Ruminococcus bromii]
MTVSERIPFSGLLLPLQEGYTYSCDRRTTTDRFFLFRMTKPGVTLTGEMSLWEDETQIGTGLPMLFDFMDEVRILK